MQSFPNIPPHVAQQLAGLTSTPLVQAAARYWWVALPLGYAAWAKYQERKRKGEVDLHTMIADMAPLVGIVATIVTLNYTLAQHAANKAAATAAPASPGAAAVDASFSINPKPVAGIGAPGA